MNTPTATACFQCPACCKTRALPSPHLKDPICSTCDDFRNRVECPNCESPNTCKECLCACSGPVCGYLCASGCSGCVARAKHVDEMLDYAHSELGDDYDNGCAPNSEWKALGGIIMPGSKVTRAGDTTHIGTVTTRDTKFVWVKWSDNGPPEPYQSGMHTGDNKPTWELRLVH
jgi:hypothetical protein